MPNKSNGIYLAFVTAVISGFSIFLNKYAVGIITPPLFYSYKKLLQLHVLILALL
jgi:hypothetical protein